MSRTEAPRLRPRLGPASVVAVILAGLLIHRYGGLRATFGQRSEASRAVSLQVDPPALGITPEIAWLLRRSEEVGLNSSQRAELQRQQAAYERATADDRQALEQTGLATRDWLDQRRETGVTRDGLDQGLAAASRLSAHLVAARETAWSRAWEALTETQQRKVLELRRAAPTELR